MARAIEDRARSVATPTLDASDAAIVSATAARRRIALADPLTTDRLAAPLTDALAGARLLRTRTDQELDHVEAVLRSGPIDASERIPVGAGINGRLYRVRVHDPVDPTVTPRWAVEKPAGGQAAQEEFGWRLARALGIDYLVAPAIRRADGAARIEYRPGIGLATAGIYFPDDLERALAAGYLADADTLGITAEQASQAARIDRQLLQVFDYLLANNDRHGGNALYDATTGALSFIDSGHAGRGQLAANGGTVLEPSLRSFQAGSTGGRIELDPVVVDLLRRRLTPERIRSLHSEVFDAPLPGPEPRSVGERFLPHVRSDTYRDGIVARLEHVLDTGGYTHRGYQGDNAGELPPAVFDMRPNVRGLRNVREQFMRF